MARIRNSFTLKSVAAPGDTTDLYPTHNEIYGKGGYRSVADIAERDAITTQRQAEGMLVNVINEDQIYQLKNGQWVPFSFGGGGGTNVDMTNYYDKTEIDQKFANAAAGGQIDLSGYASKAELDNKADITALADLATKTELNTKANATALIDYYNKTETDTKIDEKLDYRIQVISQADYDQIQVKDANVLYFVTA